MGFWGMLEVSSMPILQLLIVTVLGAFLATDSLRLLPPHARQSFNAIVFAVFTPSLIFASLANTVRFEDIISWWFMPVNMGITFLVGGLLGWIAVKIFRPQPYLGDLIIAMCATGNFANILLVIIPAICKEDGTPFGDKIICSKVGLSYVSFSMAIGSFYTWTFTYHLIRSAKAKYSAMLTVAEETLKVANNIGNADETTSPLLPKTRTIDEEKQSGSLKSLITRIFGRLVKELKTPPIVAAIIGFIFGSVSWLRDLIIGDTAPLRVINDSVTLLGDGTIPCITLILGANLTRGQSMARLKPAMIITVICVRYLILPLIGIGVVKGASHMGFLPSDPLYHFILMLQFALPPGINIGTMTELFQVVQEECSVLYLWTYLMAAIALTGWSIVLIWILS